MCGASNNFNNTLLVEMAQLGRIVGRALFKWEKPIFARYQSSIIFFKLCLKIKIFAMVTFNICVKMLIVFLTNKCNKLA